MNLLFLLPVIGLTGSVITFDQPELTIRQGTLSGKYIETISKRKISAFLGIPYAKSPTGKHRFKESVPALPWSGKLNATYIPNACLQYERLIADINFRVIGSEDCLYLNVFTPKRTFDQVSTTSLLNVIVFIHGGGFMHRSSSEYGPEYLLDKDVVLVTLNYRLGPLGFLSTEDSIIPGNNGLKDQLLALKWVQTNIQQLGGDPNKVTIAGHSAGGSSVHYHMISPRSKGLFNHAIIQSGSALGSRSQIENPKEKASLLANQLGCPTNDSNLMVACLRERPAEHIVLISSLFLVRRYIPFSSFGPVVEPKSPTAFISTPPSKIIISRKANAVPLLISFTADEGLFPGAEILGSEENVIDFNQNWEKLMPHLLDFNFTVPSQEHFAVSQRIREKYISNQNISKDQKGFIKMLGDRLVNIPISQTARLHSMHYTTPVYAYRFSYSGPVSLKKIRWPTCNYKGVSHEDDLPYIVKVKEFPLDQYPELLPLSKKIIDIWISFINDVPFPSKWLLPVRDNLPFFLYLDVNGPDLQNDRFIQEADFGQESFWKTLNINEDNKFDILQREEL